MTRLPSDQSHSAGFRRGAVAGVGAVVRGRLIELVDRVDDAQTVAITAPPGWGKSELLATWAEHRRSSMAMAWVALEAGDDSPVRFWRRFLAAVRDSSWDQRGVLETVGVGPDVEGERGHVVRAILDRLPAEAPPLAIVIDDVHLLSDGPAAEDLAQLHRYLPPSWRLVVSGRSLPLPMTRLRVAGHITSITWSELAFDDAEAGVLLEQAGCPSLSPLDLADLVACTEGWAAGLRLSAIPLSQGADVAAVLAGVRAGQHDIERYFYEELIGALPKDVVGFLLDTSVASTIDGPLAAHLSGRTDASALLRSLAASGVFTASDRFAAGSYRYHPLLAESLQRHLSETAPERGIELHRMAASWHRDREEHDLAYRHAVQSQDWSLCVELLDDLWIPLFVGGELHRLGELLLALPVQMLRDDAALRALRTLLLLDRSDAALIVEQTRVADTSSRAELVLAVEASRRAGRLDVARTAASRVFAGLPGTNRSSAALRAYVLLSLGVSEYWADDRPSAERNLRDALAETEREGLDCLRLGCLSQLVGVLTAQNRVNEAADLAESAVALAAERGWELSGWAAVLWHVLGWISYLRCDLDAAEEYLDRAERSLWYRDAVVGAMVPTVAAHVSSLRGREAQAVATLELADARLTADRDSYVFMDYIDGEKARQAVRAGELHRARTLLAGGHEHRSLHHCVAMAELLIAEHRPDDACRVLRRGLEQAAGFLDQRLHAMVLLASVEHGAQARATLVQALKLAAGERLVVPFCQVGDPIMPMIGEIGRSHRSLRPFINEIRVRFTALRVEAGLTHASPGPDELTPRELETLRHLDSHDTMAEVAARMHVSMNTLKVHTRHVYEKLGVNSRRDAIAEAVRRGLL